MILQLSAAAYRNAKTQTGQKFIIVENALLRTCWRNR